MMHHVLRACLALPLLIAAAHAQVPSAPGEWPQWRGPSRDGISTETGLLKQWPSGGPKVAWQVDAAGVGYASISIRDGRLFTQGDLGGVEHVIALSLKDGSLLWAVQPDAAARRLEEQIAREMKGADRNGDGVIDEIEALLRFGWDFNRWDAPAAQDEEALRARARKVFEKLDADGDKVLSYTEGTPAFRDVFVRIDAQDKGADVAALARKRTQAFLEALDKDRDGSISREEAKRSALNAIFDRADQKDPVSNKGDGLLSAAELEAYFAKQEAGKDGVVTLDELVAFYLQQKPRGDGLLGKAELRAAFGGYRDGTGDGPRGTPTVDGDRLYVEGANGDLSCLETATGKLIWQVNLAGDLGGGRPGWGYSESPLVLGELLIVTPGGKKGTLAALDRKTGEVKWRSAGVTEGAQYSSPVFADIAGVRQIVQFANKTCFGVTADGGRLLWQYGRAANGTANVCTPVVFDPHVFSSSAYGTGGGLAKVSVDGEHQKAEEVYFDKRMSNHHGGIVKVGDFMYGFGDGGLICMNFLSGEIRWKARSVGKGSLVLADGMLYLLGENQEIALAEATPEEYRERGRFKIPSRGRPSWAHPVVAGGRLYVRDQGFLTAYEVKAP